MGQGDGRFICIHGHFYQPPRENPWIETVEVQDSAHPYHDWNERITAECYGPNSASRIVDKDRRIIDIVSNYAKISFNFGPTLLSWMEKEAPQIYQAVLEADRLSMEQRSGHGAAIAQVYNHMIMPLASSADKRTQIIWGIREFEYRFKRFPEGMWLAETAVDGETLDILAEKGIKFTILAPHQAARFRMIGDENWIETDGNTTIDPTRAYQYTTHSGQTISLFFYDGPISRAVAFEHLLESGEGFSTRLMEGFSDQRDWPQLLHIATDGETYGHHQKFGDMALAAALRRIEEGGQSSLTNYGEYLQRFPPTHEVQIHEKTSWSCAHGIARWCEDCGCNSGGYPHWNQSWRAPLRKALDWLRDHLVTVFSRTGGRYLKNPWEARNDYIEVILERTAANVDQLLEKHSVGALSFQERMYVLKLLEMQRHAMLMYTSCGWFFDELSGPETVQIIQYASRALQLAANVMGQEQNLEKRFLEKLSEARSNIPDIGDGAWIYRNYVLPSRVDLDRVCAHFAFSSLFEDYDEKTLIGCYTVTKSDYRRLSSHEASLAIGMVDVVSENTSKSAALIFGVVRFGSHDFRGGVSRPDEESAYFAMKEEMISAFDRGLYTELVGLMDKHFGTHSYSFNDLFRDEQRRILKAIITTATGELDSVFQRLYEHNRPLIEFIREVGMPIPKTFLMAAQPALNAAIKKALEQEEIDEETLRRIVDHIEKWHVELDAPETESLLKQTMEELNRMLTEDPFDLKLLMRIRKLLLLVKALSNEMMLWQIQNTYHKLAGTVFGRQEQKAQSGDPEALAWTEAFKELGSMLYFNLSILG